jgi:prevent-host-death family protein
MKTVQASAAKTHLLDLLDDVERGETVVITRHGKPIARLVPDDSERQREIDQAIADINVIRGRNKPVTVKEILAWRDEGRR